MLLGEWKMLLGEWRKKMLKTDKKIIQAVLQACFFLSLLSILGLEQRKHL